MVSSSLAKLLKETDALPLVVAEKELLLATSTTVACLSELNL
jgi:hypothetical protein